MFKTEVHTLRIKESKINIENVFNGNYFETAIDHESATKKPCFVYFQRFLTHALTLSPRKMYIYMLRTIFGFRNFQATFCFFQRL